MNRCLICGGELPPKKNHYHSRCSKKLFHSVNIPTFNYSWDELNKLAVQIIQRRVSVPGVQPKLSLHLEKANKESPERLILVGLEGDYILKPPTKTYPYLPEAEHFCMLFAKKIKISTADFGLIPLKFGKLAYITRRMDRSKQGTLHMEDFCQLTNKQTEQKYRGSMEQIGNAIRKFSYTPGLDAGIFFDLAIFSFLTGNSDMHLKNFSLIRLADGRLRMSPAYDLVPVKIILPADKEDLALTLNGKKSNLKRNDFVIFGRTIKLTDMQIEKSIKRILTACEKNLETTLSASFLPIQFQEKFKMLFVSRLKQLVK